MALNPWDYAKSVVGTGTKMETLLAGTGGWTKGAPLRTAASGQAWLTASGGAVTENIMFVAAETVASGSYGAAIPCTPDAVFRVKKATATDVIVAGTKYALLATDMTLTTFTTATTVSVKAIGPDESDTTLMYVVSTGWLA